MSPMRQRVFLVGSGVVITTVVSYFLYVLFTPSQLLAQHVQAKQTLPYPASPLIKDISFDWSTHDEQAPGSDNWPITWADDGHQYTSWGDGGGFGGTNVDERVSLGVARLEGTWDHHTGYNVWGGKDAENPAQVDGKSYGIISVEGVLYMWVSPGSDNENYEEARLAKSTDHGTTWSPAAWAFTQADKLVLPTFCQFGRDYLGARDSYVYSYAIRLQDDSALQIQKPGLIDLMRVPKNKIMERSAYEFFAGLNINQVPTWTKDLTKRSPVFEDPNGVGWNVSVSYNAGLRRYFLSTEHTESFEGNFGIFDAPQPWGPWTTVGYYNNWGGFGSTFFWNFSNKWLSADGTTFTIIFTGTGPNDSWNTVRGSFILTDADAKLYLPLIVRQNQKLLKAVSNLCQGKYKGKTTSCEPWMRQDRLYYKSSGHTATR